METLSPLMLENRNSFLKQFKNESLEIVSKKLNELFEIEKDQLKRIVLLASRVETIRKRIENINSTQSKIEPTPNVESKEVKAPSEKKENDEKEKTDSTWVKVVMKESAEVNGVRFPEGIQIDVSQEDSKRLIKSGKAEVI